MHAGSVVCAICFVWFCSIALFRVKDVGMNISWNFLMVNHTTHVQGSSTPLRFILAVYINIYIIHLMYDLLTSIFHVGLGHIRVGPILILVVDCTHRSSGLFYAALVKKMLQKLPYNNRLL